MRVFVDTELNKIIRQSGLDDTQLCKLAFEIKNGNHDGELISNLIFKKRIGIHGQGARDGLRGIVAYRAGANLFFIDIYAKNKTPGQVKTSRKNAKEIPDEVLEIYKEYAQNFLAADDEGIRVMIANNEIREVACNG